MSRAWLDDRAERALTDAVAKIEATSAVEVAVAVRRSARSWPHVPVVVGGIAAWAALAFMLFSDPVFPLIAFLAGSAARRPGHRRRGDVRLVADTVPHDGSRATPGGDARGARDVRQSRRAPYAGPIRGAGLLCAGRARRGGDRRHRRRTRSAAVGTERLGRADQRRDRGAAASRRQTPCRRWRRRLPRRCRAPTTTSTSCRMPIEHDIDRRPRS